MAACSIRLIVGLANPGKEYAKTRHNAGAWLVESLAQQSTLTLHPETKFQGYVGKVAGCWLLVPTTYMNHSGRALAALARFYRIPPEAILVVHDDLDLCTGTARFKWSGGHGGHNGLRSVVAELGSSDFWRLRIGIGHPGHRDRVHDYVLGTPSQSDQRKIETAIDNALATFPLFLVGQTDKAMQQLHSEKNQAT